MSQLTPTKFVHPYIKLEVLFDEDDKQKWFVGVVTKVHKYGSSYVECDIKYADGERGYYVKFYDHDYTRTNEYESYSTVDAWRFTPSYNSIVTTLTKEKKKKSIVRKAFILAFMVFLWMYMSTYIYDGTMRNTMYNMIDHLKNKICCIYW